MSMCSPIFELHVSILLKWHWPVMSFFRFINCRSKTSLKYWEVYFGKTTASSTWPWVSGSFKSCWVGYTLGVFAGKVSQLPFATLKRFCQTRFCLSSIIPPRSRKNMSHPSVLDFSSLLFDWTEVPSCKGKSWHFLREENVLICHNLENNNNKERGNYNPAMNSIPNISVPSKHISI